MEYSQFFRAFRKNPGLIVFEYFLRRASTKRGMEILKNIDDESNVELTVGTCCHCVQIPQLRSFGR